MRAMNLVSWVKHGQLSKANRGHRRLLMKAAISTSISQTVAGWESLDAALQDHPDVIAAYADPVNGDASPLSLLRLFGTDGEPRVKFYRDHAAWCPYCQRVWLLLEEKRIPYSVEKINMRCYGDKPESFLAKVPRGLLPVIELDGKVMTESAEIMKVLEYEFRDVPLLPPETNRIRRAEDLLGLERKLFSAWMGWLTSMWMHDMNKGGFVKVLKRVDQELQSSEGPLFMGKDFSYVDAAFAPFLERMVASLAYYKGFHMRGIGEFPGVEAWFNAMEERPAYLATRSDHYTHCHDLPPQLGGCEMHEDGRPVASTIDGQDGKAWHLPLPPLSATSLPEVFSPGESPESDRARAAYRLVQNHAAVARFAARGAGQPGARPVWAPLSDPSAVPNEDVVEHVDAALRCIASALLHGPESCSEALQALKEDASQATVRLEDVVASLAYLRDRVGVPRDMPMPAARQLRAHINWCIDRLHA